MRYQLNQFFLNHNSRNASFINGTITNSREEILEMTENIKEEDYLLYVELPNLINRIIKLEACGPNFNLIIANRTASEIKRISDIEIESTLETIKHLNSK